MVDIPNYKQRRCVKAKKFSLAWNALPFSTLLIHVHVRHITLIGGIHTKICISTYSQISNLTYNENSSYKVHIHSFSSNHYMLNNKLNFSQKMVEFVLCFPGRNTWV